MVAVVTDSAHLSTLRLAPGAPEGALPGCRGDLVVSIDHRAGGWSSACEIDVSIDCEAAGCWWSRLVYTFTVSVALLDEAKQLHAVAAEEVPA